MRGIYWGNRILYFRKPGKGKQRRSTDRLTPPPVANARTMITIRVCNFRSARGNSNGCFLQHSGKGANLVPVQKAPRPEYQGYNNPSFDLLWHPLDDARSREQHSLRPETRAGESSNSQKLGPGRGPGPSPGHDQGSNSPLLPASGWKCHDGDDG